MKYLFTSIFLFASLPVFAAQNCLQGDSDTDGDGWGWENGQSCVVADIPLTGAACIDNDGDGWGWDGSGSCLVTDIDLPTGSACIDTDGDGWGWDGTDSCVIEQIGPTEPTAIARTCVDTAPVDDTWGWNGVTSCRIPPVLMGGDTSAIAGVYDAGDPDFPEERDYLEISPNGSYTSYYSFSGADCFVRDVSTEGEDRVAISPLGGNLYQFDSVYYHSFTVEDGTVDEHLEVTTDILTLYVDSDNQLIIEIVDTADDDLDGNTSEIDRVVYPAANVDLETLSICADFG